MISLTIDGLPVSATQGMTVLGAAEKAGISVPKLCHHDSSSRSEPAGFAWWRPSRFRRMRGETLL